MCFAGVCAWCAEYGVHTLRRHMCLLPRHCCNALAVELAARPLRLAWSTRSRSEALLWLGLEARLPGQADLGIANTNTAPACKYSVHAYRGTSVSAVELPGRLTSWSGRDHIASTIIAPVHAQHAYRYRGTSVRTESVVELEARPPRQTGLAGPPARRRFCEEGIGG